MIKPFLQNESFLADVHAAHSGDNFFLWWLGQSGFLLRWRNQFLLLDPYLSDSLTTKYAATDKPHVRMTERVIAPEKLDFIHAITSSHNHTDHLDAETLQPILRAASQKMGRTGVSPVAVDVSSSATSQPIPFQQNQQSQPNPNTILIIPEANREFVAHRLQCPPEFPIGLDAGQSATAVGFTFHGVPAAHEKIDHDSAGRCQYLGYVIQFGPWTIYHSGDTIRHDAILEALEPFSIDLALLPINGATRERRVAGNLDGPQAATLAHDINARLVIPCHYEMFEFNTASPDLFVQTCQTLNQPHRILKAGERWSSGEL
jgi:L-ascorbate metabolism protein UlaG (beta-lactamase superfamily)